MNRIDSVQWNNTVSSANLLFGLIIGICWLDSDKTGNCVCESLSYRFVITFDYQKNHYIHKESCCIRNRESSCCILPLSQAKMQPPTLMPQLILVSVSEAAACVRQSRSSIVCLLSAAAVLPVLPIWGIALKLHVSGVVPRGKVTGSKSVGFILRAPWTARQSSQKTTKSEMSFY